MSDLAMKRGDTPTFKGTVMRDGAAVDLRLANTTLKFTAKRSRSHPLAQAVIQKATGGSGITVPGTAPGNVYNVSPSAADTSNFTKDESLFYDVELTEPNGTVTTVVSGRLLVSLDATA